MVRARGADAAVEVDEIAAELRIVLHRTTFGLRVGILALESAAMKPSLLQLFLASLAVSSFAVAGCAADTTAAADGEEAEDVGVSADEISSRAAPFVGSYAWRAGDSGAFVDFQQLTLEASGAYSASVDAQLVNPAIQCIAFPCTQPESGTWRIIKSGGKLKLKVSPSGPKPTRSYYASIQEQTRTLGLTRFGQSTSLFFQGSTCANVRCTATTHCEMSYGKGGYAPACVPNAPAPPPATCAATLCGPGTMCVEKPTGAECVATPPPPAACVKSGCSGQICADEARISTCEYRPEYACYQAATCERQATGACGWTQTPALTTCIANAGN
jgi:hypothetical protein